VRKPLVVGNWKMNTTQQEATNLTRSVVDSVSAYAASVEVVLLPPFPWLTDIARLLPGSAVALGAQNMHTESGGAYTGEVSPRMLKGLCRYVLVGQYERRILFSERDAIVRRKLHAAQQHGLRPILCVGEDADQLDEGLGTYVVGEQIEADLEGANLQESLVIAYDPAWTTMGLVAPPPLDYVGKVISHIRDTLSSLFSFFAGPGDTADLRRLRQPPQHRRNRRPAGCRWCPGRHRQPQRRQLRRAGARVRTVISSPSPSGRGLG